MAGKLFSTLTVMAIILVVGGFYVGYREDQAAGLGKITSLSQIDGLSPIQCLFQPGAFGAGSGGEMYIYDNLIRVEVVDLEINGYSGSMNAIIGTDGTLQFSPSSVPADINYQDAEDALNSLITSAPWQCDPWWFPNSSLFNIPNAITP